MGLPITSATGNFLVGAVTGAVAEVVNEKAEEAGVSTLGQIGLSIGVGVPGVLITKGQLFPYMGGVLAGYGVAELVH
jgi:hypothetical protein